mmetsp:Transcript_19038/g.33028  ORF Transcript_19038/g.33028 Transcript_19038/m.33028 type:complete len:290 (-) Transcript_19038:1468-2337(-)
MRLDLDAGPAPPNYGAKRQRSQRLVFLAVLPSQPIQPFDGVRHTFLPMLPSVPGPDRHSPVITFIGPANQDEIVLCDLSIADLLGERIVAKVSVNEEARVVELLLHRGGVLVVVMRDGNDEDLTGRDPEWPLARPVLCQYRQHPLHAAQDGPVDHHWPRVGCDPIDAPSLACGLPGFLFLGTHDIRQLEALRKAEVQLDGCTLVLAFHAIFHLDIDFGAIECGVFGVVHPILEWLLILPVFHELFEGPDARRGPVVFDLCPGEVFKLLWNLAEIIHRLGQTAFGIIPNL